MRIILVTWPQWMSQIKMLEAQGRCFQTDQAQCTDWHEGFKALPSTAPPATNTHARRRGPLLHSYTMTSSPTVTGYITSWLTVHLSAGSLALCHLCTISRGRKHMHIFWWHSCSCSEEEVTKSSRLSLTHTHVTNLWLFGELSCSRVPDAADVQNLCVLKNNVRRFASANITY